MAGFAQLFRVAAKETAEETREEIIATARREHARVMQAEPRPSRFIRTVDGVRGASEEAVRADGRIEYVYPRLEEVVRFALETLFDLSPVLSGDYRNGHQLFVDGVAVPNLEAWDGESEVVICNYLPYARKIEVGKMRMRVPGTDHVYEQAEVVVAQRYGNAARVFFTYQGVMQGARLGRAEGGNRSDLRYPCLRIRSR